MKLGVRPTDDRIIVEAIDEDQVTASGIVIPDSAKEKPQRATVLAVGPGRRSEKGERIPLDIDPGDIILHSKYGGAPLTVGGRDVLVLREGDVLAVECDCAPDCPSEACAS